jgi:hypothetical protein
VAGLSSNQVFALSTAGFAGLYNAEIAAEIGNLKTSQIVGVSIAAGAAQAAVKPTALAPPRPARSPPGRSSRLGPALPASPRPRWRR